MNEIIQGDAYELIKTIPDNSIDLIYTDIPYLFASGGKSGDLVNRDYLEEIQFWQEKMDNASSKDEYEKAHERKGKYLIKQATRNINTGINWDILNEFDRVQEYIYIYIWCSKEQIPYLINYYVTERKCNFQILVWCKTNPTPFVNNSFLPDLEYCLFFREQNNPHRLEGKTRQKSKWYMSGANVEDKKHYSHPTIKPLELVKRHIEIATKEGDVVLDPFCGSGTTCLAAKELNRNYIGFELDEKYAKIAQDRLEGWDAHGQYKLL